MAMFDSVWVFTSLCHFGIFWDQLQLNHLSLSRFILSEANPISHSSVGLVDVRRCPFGREDWEENSSRGFFGGFQVL